MNIKPYLERIKYSGPISPTLEVLTQLQAHHLLNVPFENLDIHYKKPIKLVPELLYKKIVFDNRGGFCYELNGLFYELLVAFNFEVIRVSARVFTPSNDYSEEFDHMALLVHINGEIYLSDVGFGDFTMHPLKLELHRVQHDPNGDFLVDKYTGDYYRVSSFKDEKAIPCYIFKDTAYNLDAFNEMCYYHQHSSHSHFTKNRLISMATPEGRFTITGNQLKINRHGVVYERHLIDEIAFIKELWSLFEIKNFQNY